MQTKEMIMEVINSWKYPAGFITEGAVGNTNGVLLVQCIQNDFGGVFTHANLDAAVSKLDGKLAYNVRVVERAPSQTQATVDAVYREWVSKYAPKDLKQTPENAAILSAYVKTYFAGVYSITSMNEAAKNSDGLQYVTEADKSKATRKKMNEDYQNSLPHNQKPDLEGRAATQHKQDEVKKIDAINKEIASFINRYTCNNSNGPGINYSTTEARHEEMHKTANGFGKTLKDREAALKAVKERYFSYPS